MGAAAKEVEWHFIMFIGLAPQWILRGFFLSLPADIEDASNVDGCTHVQSLVRIVLPLSAPGLVAAAMFGFLLSWNEYFYALVFLQSNEQMTLPIGIQTTSYTKTTIPEDWIHLSPHLLLCQLLSFS